MEFIVVSEQLLYMLYSVIFGLFEGLLYTLIKVLRIAVGVSRGRSNSLDILKINNKLPKIKIKIPIGILKAVFIHILDILYFIISASAFSVFVLYFNHGRIRWYLLLSVCLGFIIWYHSLGRLIMFISEYLVSIIKTFTKLFLCGIIIPLIIFAKPFRLLYGMIYIRYTHKYELKKLRKIIFEG